MNDLYEAVVILGKSVEDIDKYGWVCSSYGYDGGPKCVNGVLSIAAGSQIAVHVQDYAFLGSGNDMREPLRLACIALVETAPQHIKNALIDLEDNGMTDFARKFLCPQELDLRTLGSLLIHVNDATDGAVYDEEAMEMVDTPMLNREGARDWFSRAFDKLAEQLPEPIPAEPPLTVKQIIETPSELTIELA